MTAAILSARRAAKAYRASGDRFEEGRVFAYYDLITSFQEQAELMGIEFADKSLAEFQPDIELILPGKTDISSRDDSNSSH